jgi:hypothetical protein
MGLPKSKAQIGWGRYWVVCLLGGFWGGFCPFELGDCLRGACLSVFLGLWPFLVLLVVY